jgi:hypothetical protein
VRCVCVYVRVVLGGDQQVAWPVRVRVFVLKQLRRLVVIVATTTTTTPPCVCGVNADLFADLPVVTPV